MRLVVIETPYAGDVKGNTAYARACLLDCLKRGEAPIASHLLYTQVLDDNDPEERNLGIKAGHDWIRRADACILYTDKGITPGMEEAALAAVRMGRFIEYRKLGKPEKAGGR